MAIPTEVNLEGGVPSEQGGQRRADRTGLGQRQYVTGADQAAIAGGATGTDGGSFHHSHVTTGLRQIMSRGDSDHPAADNHNPGFTFHDESRN